MRVFEDRERPATDNGRLHSEPDSRYMNRSGRLPIVRFREAIEHWFARYPVSHQNDLRQRLRSNDNEVHRAAFFELALHEMCLGAGLKPEVHPEVPGTEKRPDFALRSQSGEFLGYLEAVRASGVSAEEAAAEKRINAAYDVLETVSSPDFFVGIRYLGAPRSSPPARAMRAFLQERLAGADYDGVVNAWEIDEVTEWRFSHDGWDLAFFPMPKDEESRGEPGIRPLGLFFQEAHTIDPVGELHAALKRKASRYGELPGPYLIAVNAAAMAADRDAMMKALFGTLSFRFPSREGPKAGSMVRNPDGIWFGGTIARNTRVSGVLHVDYTHPTAVANAGLTLIENPWGKRPPPKLPHLPRLEVVAGSQDLRDVPGLPMFRLLGLDSADFPGRDESDE